MMQPSNVQPSFVASRRAQGVPIVFVLVAVVAALLLGMFIGKSGVKPVADPQSVATQASSDSSLFNPASGDLGQCQSENSQLLLALDRAGGDTSRFRGTNDRDDEDDSYDSTRSEATSSGRRTSFGGTATKQRQEEIRQTANVRVWAGRAQKIANRPDILASGSAYNRESVAVEGVLYVSLVAADGTVLDEASLPLLLQSGRTEWEHVFRWVPDDDNMRYSAQVEWETLGF